MNSLTTSVEVPAGAVSSGLSAPPPSRTPPLPYFLLEEGDFGDDSMAEYDGLVPARPVSPETEKAISSLLALTPAIKPLMPPPRNLTEETAAPSGGEDYALSLIVSDRITAKDWPAAVDQLRDYLSLNRSPKAAARAHYYLGEALTYMGLAREAFFEFLRPAIPIRRRPSLGSNTCSLPCAAPLRDRSGKGSLWVQASPGARRADGKEGLLGESG